jgi:tRNA A37 threonylcarbamoyladenosine dehydratase
VRVEHQSPAPRRGRSLRTRQGRDDGRTLSWINPAIDAEPVASFLTPSNLSQLLDRDFDLVLDACDSFRTKVEAIAWCRRRKQPIVTVGSAGGRTDATQVRVRDLSRTEHDAMLSLIRKKLRAEFNFPRNADRYFGVSAVYSLENVRYPQATARYAACGPRSLAMQHSSSIAARDWVPRHT